MTIDKAKIKIEELACYARTKGWDDEYTEAVNMIIKALEQQPTDAVDRATIKEYLYCLGMGIKVTATDCIRRQDVEDAIYDYSRPCDVNYAQIMEFIDKLPSVTPQPCDDAVSRQAALDVIEREQFKGDAISEIEKLPSVSPQQKMGKWIMSDDGLYRPICNNCGAHPWKGYIPTVEEATDVFKYCPNCGAKMSEIPTGEEGSDKE